MVISFYCLILSLSVGLSLNQPICRDVSRLRERVSLVSSDKQSGEFYSP